MIRHRITASRKGTAVSPTDPRHPIKTSSGRTGAALAVILAATLCGGGVRAGNWSCEGASNGQWDCASSGAAASTSPASSSAPSAAAAATHTSPAADTGYSKGFHPIDTVMGWLGGNPAPEPAGPIRTDPPSPAEARALSPADVAAAAPALEPLPTDQTPIPEPGDLNRGPVASGAIYPTTPLVELPPAAPQSSIATGTVATPNTPPPPRAPAPKKPTASAPMTASIPSGGKGLTLQLMSASSRAGMDRFIQENHLKDAWVIREHRQGRTLFVLLYGRYANRDQAIAARDSLPASVGRADPWIRDLSALQPLAEGAP